MEKCIRCERVLESEEDFQTGVCADCWEESDYQKCDTDH